MGLRREKHVIFKQELEAEFPIYPSLDGPEDERLSLPTLCFLLLFFSTWSQTASKSSRRLN